ncbi:hypothetical protein CD30_13290 [Ureibacillus massiliensis 4400831 = CIP 108448 = CCUG 49529]|uniref:Short-chain dehydrogenase n=1 Tax=Ureibacillus massiliensis 4400831 = CIP 108448 = CCUG 49529 TaxID=1211035 RepID=A0A0A3IZG9_9BACL|nr:oxidoreductase [Ureibacillus massiliensis]KGR90121.1 hypothetical protein CD30_13290 [Ureibacillus massiliensis 4400831 = CIP 108448 = CCUG 49529]
MTLNWTKDDIQDQSGKVVIVTGANRGIGFETAQILAEKNATVILAVRDLHKGRIAKEKIISNFPNAKVDVMYLDLNDLATVNNFVDEFKGKYHSLSILINNAGIMSPKQQLTKNGFESQFGVNYLGHFALTGLLLDLLIKTSNSRVISVGSLIAHKTKVEFGHFKGTKKYNMAKFYAQSKLACMYFAKQLQSYFTDNRLNVLSIACHPGIAKTNIFNRQSSRAKRAITNLGVKLIGQETQGSALPILFAATDETLTGGEYIGPSNRRKGDPKKLDILDQLYKKHVAQNLWDVSEMFCGVKYPLKVKI